MGVQDWSQTAATNATADANINWREGQAPSTVNDSARQLMAAIAKRRDDLAGIIATGGGTTAYTVATSQVYLSLVDGLVVAFTPHATSGANPTLNVDSLGAKPLRSITGQALSAGVLLAGTPYIAVYRLSTDEWMLFSTVTSIPAGSLTVGMAPDNVWTYAKLQQISADKRVLGLDGSAPGNIEEVTLTQFLDWIGSAAQGDILYRGASDWARLGAGTDGQFLRTRGAAANPDWASPQYGLALLNSGALSTVSALDVVLTGYTNFRGLKLKLINIVPATDDVPLYCRLSTDGGSSFDVGASDYAWSAFASVLNAALSQSGSGATDRIQVMPTGAAGNNVSNVAAEGGISVELDLMGQTETGIWSRVSGSAEYWNATGNGQFVGRFTGQRKAAQDTDAIRILFSSGNIASGKWALYGYT